MKVRQNPLLRVETVSMTRFAMETGDRMKIPKLGSSVHVLWVDSCGCRGWSRADEHENLCLSCETLGWLVVVNKQYITIAGSIEATGNTCNHQMSIPLVAVKSIRVVGNS